MYIDLRRVQNSHVCGFSPNEDISLSLIECNLGDPITGLINILGTNSFTKWLNQALKVHVGADFLIKFNDIMHLMEPAKS